MLLQSREARVSETRAPRSWKSNLLPRNMPISWPLRVRPPCHQRRVICGATQGRCIRPAQVPRCHLRPVPEKGHRRRLCTPQDGRFPHVPSCQCGGRSLDEDHARHSRRSTLPKSQERRAHKGLTPSQEWLISTPKHLALYEAFGWEPPTFAHLGLLVNADGTKLSKRNDSVNLAKYQNAGIFPMALLAWLANLGSSFKSDTKPPRLIADVADSVSSLALSCFVAANMH